MLQSIIRAEKLTRKTQAQLQPRKSWPKETACTCCKHPWLAWTNDKEDKSQVTHSEETAQWNNRPCQDRFTAKWLNTGSLPPSALSDLISVVLPLTSFGVFEESRDRSAHLVNMQHWRSQAKVHDEARPISWEWEGTLSKFTQNQIHCFELNHNKYSNYKGVMARLWDTYETYLKPQRGFRRQVPLKTR